MKRPVSWPVLPTGMYSIYIKFAYLVDFQSAWHINFNLLYVENLVYIWCIFSGGFF